MAFRDWLHMMFDQDFQSDIGEGYAASGAAQHVGLLTFRYLNLFCVTQEDAEVVELPVDPDALVAFESSHCFVDYFVRSEMLEDDLFRALRASGVAVDEALEHRVRAMRRTNVSSTRSGADAYYDRDTISLVASGDRLVVDKFSYAPPSVVGGGGAP